ncbi:hypothetical protein PAXRUDRAFT_151529 [Paxillus rubicundulus Ve08.2h10]|uniref:Uncharacterized protein n=1 Tax=Paxillus rubicundulus Ve08.2h10 TaxID=930991 RepID=A0A0D0D273_9AGAM|nr:hypothetical protein PAXRUDRAFT_151529 [Paxillus rubicundulus Ve08.2h10]
MDLYSSPDMLAVLENSVSLINPIHVVPTVYQPVSRPLHHIRAVGVRRTRRLVHFVVRSPLSAAKFDSDYSRTVGVPYGPGREALLSSSPSLELRVYKMLVHLR